MARLPLCKQVAKLTGTVKPPLSLLAGCLEVLERSAGATCAIPVLRNRRDSAIKHVKLGMQCWR